MEYMCMKVLFRRHLALALLALVSGGAYAQRVAVKSNALYWAAASPNLGVEFRLSRHFTLNVEAAANPFQFGKDIQPYFAGLTPEVRYWFEARPHARHFIGAMALGSIYDIRFKEKCHEGTAFGAGLTYGYSFVLSSRWSVETTVGAGVLRYKERRYDAGSAAPARTNNERVAFAPLKLGVSFVYLIK